MEQVEQTKATMMKMPWWYLAMTGLFLLIFGILAILWPGPTVLVLVIMFGAMALVQGIFTLFAGIANPKFREMRGTMVLTGVISIIIGMLVLIWPDITALAVLYIIGAFAIIIGISAIVFAFSSRRGSSGSDRVLIGVLGLIGITFGVLIFAWPGAGGLTIVWLIGTWAVVYGVLAIILGFQVRRANKQASKAAT